MGRERRIDLAEFGRVSTTIEVEGGWVAARQFVMVGLGIGAVASLRQRLTAAQARETGLAYLAAAMELEAESEARS